MKLKRGRPKLAKGEARGILIGARFSPTEAKEVKDAIKKSKKKKSDWIRENLLKAAEGQN